ncbi:hypothetical protein DT035_16065 [Bacillus subtilis]|uniref:hypothetical protein n=1 Tax=Bacillus subtilis TaxID=1423 RepID=UPI0015F5693C|nr:hypothetical protein [Bacillus subtilis]MBA5716308.1 hypothetical protein [Bacillus subtilis]
MPFSFQSVRVEINDAAARGDNFEFLVVTGSMHPPIVCLADNNGFPYVRDIYARASDKHHGKQGVHVSVRFEAPPVGGAGFALNLAQPGMEGDFTVIPLV